MKTVQRFKDVRIENLVLSANTLVLLKTKEVVNKTTNDITSYIDVMEVCEVVDTKPITLIKSLLKYSFAEWKTANEFKTKHEKTGVSQCKVLQPFLNTNFVFKTDSNGKINRAFESEIKLNRTAMAVRDKHSLTTCDSANLKGAIHFHSLAVLDQLSYYDNIEAIVKAINEQEMIVKAEKEAKATEKAAKTRSKKAASKAA